MTMPPGGQQMGSIDLSWTPVVKRIILSLAGIWITLSFLQNFMGLSWATALYRELGLTPQETLYEFKLWQVVTYAMMHDMNAASHILFNLLGIFVLGPSLERRWGARGFLQFFVFAAVISGVFTLVCGLLVPEVFGARVVGISGSVMALLAAFSLVIPEATILLFFIIPVKAKWLIWLALGIDLLFFLPGNSGMAFHTHLGGALAAWLLITGNWRPQLAIDRIRLWWLSRRGNPKPKSRKFTVIDGGKGGPKTLN